MEWPAWDRGEGEGHWSAAVAVNALSVCFGEDWTRRRFTVTAASHAAVPTQVKCETDEISHLYTLVIYPDRTYDICIDNKKIHGGNLLEDFEFLAPPRIPDPAATKPADWADDVSAAVATAPANPVPASNIQHCGLELP